MNEVDRIVAELTGPPSRIEAAETGAGLPDAAGFYAWWTTPGSIPGVPPCRHPQEELDLFYVGISPSRPTSNATVRSRVIRNHLRGNISSSTFRFTLAALLAEVERFVPEESTSRVLLSQQDNLRLSSWQRSHLRLTWARRNAPWKVEQRVIQILAPPLNLAGNREHPFWRRLTQARKRFRSAAQQVRP